jgi:hypothetical protein
MKKHRKIKRTISIFVMFALCMNMLTLSAWSVGLERSSTGDPWQGISEETRQKMVLQEKPLQAWEVLYELFEFVDDVGNVYPDDFAGGWIDGGNLHISLTENADISRYKELLRDFDCVVFETAKYSLNELNRIRRTVSDTLQKEGFSIIGHGVDEMNNKITLTYSQSDNVSEMALRSSLADTGICEKLFVLEKGGQIEFHNAPNVVGARSVLIRRNGNNIGTVSIGACGEWGIGATGFITSGHGLRVRDTVHWPTSPHTEIGSVVSVQFHSGGFGDYALVVLNQTGGAILTRQFFDGSNNQNFTDANISDPPQGSIVLRNGAATPATTTARVASRDWADEPNSLRGITMATITNNVIPQGGDSGGTIRVSHTVDSTGNLVAVSDTRFAGVLSAGGTLSSGARYIAFTPPRYLSGFVAQTW